MKNCITISLIFIYCLISIDSMGDIVKSNLGAREICIQGTSEEYVSVTEYIQDGLVAIWDGVENIDWGKSDSSILSMYDLMDDTHTLKFNFDSRDGYWFYNRQWRNLNLGNTSIQAEEYTFEICVKKPDSTPVSVRYYPILSIASSESQCITFKPSNGRARLYITSRDSETATNYYVDWEDLTYGYTATYSIINHTAYGHYNGIYCGAVANRNLDGRVVSRIRLNADSTSTSFSPCWVGCIRLYNRKLSNEEIAYNAEIDRVRYLK